MDTKYNVDDYQVIFMIQCNVQYNIQYNKFELCEDNQGPELNGVLKLWDFKSHVKLIFKIQVIIVPSSTSTYKLEGHFFRHGRRTVPKFGTHVPIDTLTLKKLTQPTPWGFRGLFDVVRSYTCVCVRVVRLCAFFDTAVGPHRAQIWHTCADR